MLYNTMSAQTEANDSTRTIMLKKDNEPKAIEIFTGKEQRLPTEDDGYLPIQDSVFNAAKKMNIPFMTRARQDIMFSEGAWNFSKEIFKGTPWQRAMADIKRLNPDIFMPSDVDLATHEYHLRQSMYVPYVNTIPISGLKIPLSEIATFAGLKEDVSPEIRYSLEYSSEVEIVIYSVRAIVINTLFKGVQKPGNYKITWNLRDEYGKPMPSGDYIAEVRIGDERYIRKKIEIP